MDEYPWVLFVRLNENSMHSVSGCDYGGRLQNDGAEKFERFISLVILDGFEWEWDGRLSG